MSSRNQNNYNYNLYANVLMILLLIMWHHKGMAHGVISCVLFLSQTGTQISDEDTDKGCKGHRLVIDMD